MREIWTCILRLMVDTEASQALRGVLHIVANGEEHTFSDEQSLLVLLHQMSADQSTPDCNCETHHS